MYSGKLRVCFTWICPESGISASSDSAALSPAPCRPTGGAPCGAPDQLPTAAALCRLPPPTFTEIVYEVVQVPGRALKYSPVRDEDGSCRCVCHTDTHTPIPRIVIPSDA